MYSGATSAACPRTILETIHERPCKHSLTASLFREVRFTQSPRNCLGKKRLRNTRRPFGSSSVTAHRDLTLFFWDWARTGTRITFSEHPNLEERTRWVKEVFVAKTEHCASVFDCSGSRELRQSFFWSMGPRSRGLSVKCWKVSTGRTNFPLN